MKFLSIFPVKLKYDVVECNIWQEQARKEREEVDRMLEENKRRVEEAQGREALKLIQRQK